MDYKKLQDEIRLNLKTLDSEKTILDMYDVVFRKFAWGNTEFGKGALAMVNEIEKNFKKILKIK